MTRIAGVTYRCTYVREWARLKEKWQLTMTSAERSANVDARYRSEEALTISLMGLLAEESLIAQRLGKLGSRKKLAAPAA